MKKPSPFDPRSASRIVNSASARFFVLLVSTVLSRGQSLSISNLSGPVTEGEVNSFITYMELQTPPQTPWGAVNGTSGDHNEWADGTGGRDLEAMGEMYEITSNVTILNQMISWCDDCTSQRNDLMAASNGGQRVMWTGKIDDVWCPNEPSSANARYAGCENEDTEGHLAFCAKLILQSPGLWNLTVPDGNPYGYGATYFQRATNYLGKCDQANEEYSLVWFIQKGTSLIVPPTNAAWLAFDENVTANNRQMMFTSGFQRLAEAHQILGDNPALAAQYNAIVQATINQDLAGMVDFDPYTAKGQTVYDWGYYPASDAPEATEIHAEYDIIGIWRAFNNTNYGVTRAPLIPFANTMADVIYLGTNTFAGYVNGTGTQRPIYSGWFWTADWNPLVYNILAGAAYTNGWYTGSPDIDAAILFMKSRRYQQFSVTPIQSSQVVPAGNQASFTLAVAPLGGSTNIVDLNIAGLPPGAAAGFSPDSVDCGTLNFASANSILSVQTSASTPAGSYPLSIISTNGSASHTNLVNLYVGTFYLSASPSSQTVSIGGNTTYIISTETDSGFSGGDISLGLSGLPANCSASFSPGSISGAGSATLSISVSNNAAIGAYPLTILGTNGAWVMSAPASLQIVTPASTVWNGGSDSDSDWNDAANWGGLSPASGTALVFAGTARLVNTNNSVSGTAYSSIVFSKGAGPFVLNGNPVTVGEVTNDSANPQTINLGLDIVASQSFNGVSNTLIIGGGVTNGVNSDTLTLAGTGILTNLLGSTPSTATNTLALNSPDANWMLLDNPSAISIAAPWALDIAAGTFIFGSGSSAPRFTGTTLHNLPQDNQLGAASGASATLNIVNGTLSLNTLNTGNAFDSTGIVNQTGGTLNLGPTGPDEASDYFQGANGQNAGEVSIVNISGGTMNLGTGSFYVASRDNGTLTLSGTGALICGKLDVSRNAYGNTEASVGVVNLNGGTLTVTRVGTATANAQTGGAPAATFNFNGGMLMAAAGSTAFYQGSTASPVCPITSYVLAGGAIINDGGNSITFLEPLQSGAAPDGGLTKLGGGTVTLGAVNTYNGDTTIDAGALALTGGGSIADSAAIVIAGGATLNVAGLSSTFTLGSGQVLSNSAPTATVAGNFNTGAGTLSLTYARGLPSLSVSTGTLVLSADTGLTINNIGAPLGEGAYSIIAEGGGTVAGTVPASYAMAGSGIAAGATGSLALSGGALILTVSEASPPRITGISVNGTTLTISAANGVAGRQFVLLGSTNLALPADDWTPLLTNEFDGNGDLNLATNVINPDNPLEFYMLQTP